MKVVYGKTSIGIIPETDRDEIYLESVLGLKTAHDRAVAERIPAAGMLLTWAYLEIRKGEKS